jgi:hypothetical protein
MSDEEKDKETTHHVRNPLACKCGYCSELANPPPGFDYTPFFRCPILLLVILHILVLFNIF